GQVVGNDVLPIGMGQDAHGRKIETVDHAASPSAASGRAIRLPLRDELPSVGKPRPTPSAAIRRDCSASCFKCSATASRAASTIRCPKSLYAPSMASSKADGHG